MSSPDAVQHGGCTASVYEDKAGPRSPAFGWLWNPKGTGCVRQTASGLLLCALLAAVGLVRGGVRPGRRPLTARSVHEQVEQ